MYALLQINHKVVQAVYLTLLHSLWQGLLSAAIAGVIIMLTQKRSSYTRYNLLIATMALFFVSVVATFCWQWASLNKYTAMLNVDQQVLVNDALNNEVFKSNQSNLAENIIIFFNRNSSLVVLLWVMVVVLRSLQLLIDFRKIHVLKTYSTFNAGQYWNNRLKDLSLQIGLNKTVILLQSGIAKVPMVVGHFKPVILFPAGIFISLPPDEIEAVLLHELAHIKRKDYIINMMQAVAELLFFFNPTVTWLSATIRDERENCCDDIALGHVKSRKQFVKALVAFQEYNITSTGCAATFPGRKNHLLNRVKRIITNNNKTLTHMEKFLLAACIVISGLITVAFSQSKEKPVQKKESKAQSQSQSSSNEEIDEQQDTVNVKKSREKKESRNNITTTIDGKKYQLRETNDSITFFSVDDEEIPAEQLKNYQPAIDKIHAQIKEQSHKLREKMAQLQTRQKLLFDKQSRLAQLDMKLQADKLKGMQKLLMDEKAKLMQQDFEKQSQIFREQQEKFRQQTEQNQKELKEKMDEQSEIFKQQQDQFRQQADENRRKFTDDQGKKMEAFKRQREEFSRQAQENRIKLRQDFEQNSKQFTQQQDAFRKQMEQNQIQLRKEFKRKSEEFKQQQREFRRQSEEFQRQFNDSLRRSSYHLHKSFLVKSDPVAGEIADRLKEENIIHDRNNMSFKLTNEELIVNGVKQSDEVQKKFIEKYLKGPEDKFSLSYSTKSQASGR